MSIASPKPVLSFYKRYFYRSISRQISKVTRYYDRIVQFRRGEWDQGFLLDRLACSEKSEYSSASQIFAAAEVHERTAVLLNGNFNYHTDIQSLLLELFPRISRTTRLIVIAYDPYLKWLFQLATWVGLRRGKNGDDVFDSERYS